jgi:predicted aldo/keto reductase-like oxidoreductase
MSSKLKPFKLMDRRRFIQVSAAAAALAGLPFCVRSSDTDRWGKILPSRRLGKTGLEPTIFCIGGGPFDADFQNLESIVEAAIQGGCRFFETARAYGRGESEKGFGKYLIPAYRDDIILMSKTHAKDAEAAMRDLDTSMENMKTDFIDIYLIHAIGSPEDLEERLTGGVFDALVRAKEEGMIGHIGFSGHADPKANNYFINKGFDDLEVMLVPVNAADPVQHSFIVNTLPLAREKNIGVIAMKVFAGGGFHGIPVTWGRNRGEERPGVIPEIISRKEAHHFALSMPVATTTIGCHDAEHVQENIANTWDFSKIDDAQYADMVARITDVALNHTIEHYKSMD